jgi:hypothetical protein
MPRGPCVCCSRRCADESLWVPQRHLRQCNKERRYTSASAVMALPLAAVAAPAWLHPHLAAAPSCRPIQLIVDLSVLTALKGSLEACN